MIKRILDSLAVEVKAEVKQKEKCTGWVSSLTCGLALGWRNRGRLNTFYMYASSPGGTLGIFGWGCAAGTLEHLAYTRARSSEFCYLYTRLNSQNSPLSQSSCFPETTEVKNTFQPKQYRFDFFSYF